LLLDKGADINAKDETVKLRDKRYNGWEQKLLHTY